MKQRTGWAIEVNHRPLSDVIAYKQIARGLVNSLSLEELQKLFTFSVEPYKDTNSLMYRGKFKVKIEMLLDKKQT